MSKTMKYHTIGLMSGTSLDGLDIAYCIFSKTDDRWSYQIGEAITVSYPDHLYDLLAKSTELSGLDLNLLDVGLGKWMGDQTKQFITHHGLNIDLIASHGHTVFHQPENGLTLQIGSGQEIFNACRTSVVNDFRSKDVSLGGNGAPLVPIGDQLLFGKYEGCLNLGGIANISYQENKARVAYDIAPVNIALNHLAKQLGKPYDDRGKMAQSGRVDNNLLQKFNALSFYKKLSPKSLGYEWVEENIFPLLACSTISKYDQLATVVEHVAIQIASSLPVGETLVTGGGAYHDFLMEKINSKVNKNQTLIIPDERILEFKESLIFAFLGVLKVRGEANCLSSVTGASMDSSGGVIYR